MFLFYEKNKMVWVYIITWIVLISFIRKCIRFYGWFFKWADEKTNVRDKKEEKVEKEEEGHRIITQEERLERAKAELEFMRKHPGTRC